VRRVQAILSIIALLAVPLALFARGEACQNPVCACCMAHSSQTHGKGMSCSHCAGQGKCGMSATTPDYGVNSPMAPTMAEALVAIVEPSTVRAAVPHFVSSRASGFAFLPFEPPRA
jgi:hypothetical protein